jgi:hypothetical protein
VRSLHDLPLGGTDYTALSTAALQPPSLANSSDNSSLVCDNVLTGAYFRFLCARAAVAASRGVCVNGWAEAACECARALSVSRFEIARGLLV